MESGGLPLNIAQQRLVEYGPNVLTPPKRVHPLIAYLKCVAATFNALLVICGVLEWVLLYYPGNFPVNTYLGAILVAVALINGFIEFYQHQKSAKLLESFLVSRRRKSSELMQEMHITYYAYRI